MNKENERVFELVFDRKFNVGSDILKSSQEKLTILSTPKLNMEIIKIKGRLKTRKYLTYQVGWNES